MRAIKQQTIGEAARVNDPTTPPSPPLDVAARYRDIWRLAASYYRQPATQKHLRDSARAGKAGRRLELEDFCQEVAMLIFRKTTAGGKSAYDPARASFSKWVWQCCFSVASHATERREGDALYSDPAKLDRVAADPMPDPEFPADTRAREALELAMEQATAEVRAEVKSLARAVQADERTGQGRLFALADELPVISGLTKQ